MGCYVPCPDASIVEMKLVFFLFSLFLLMTACDSREPSVMVYTWPGGRGEDIVALPKDKVREYINSCDIILRVTCEDEFDLSPDIETKLTRRYRVQSVVKGDVAPGDILWEDYYLEYTPQEIREQRTSLQNEEQQRSQNLRQGKG